MRFVIAFLWVVFLYSCKENPAAISNTENKLDIGITEVSLESPTKGNAHLPRLKANGNTLHMIWVEQEGALAILKYAYYADAKWSQPETIASGTDWFVNWADFPAVAENNGAVMATFLQKSAKGTYDYDIKYTLRDKITGTWSTPEILHNDGIAAEHGFVTVLPYDTGFFATWLDGRNTKPGGSGHDSHDSHGSGGAMTLRSAIVGIDGTITLRKELDNRICDCCNTAAVETENGLVVVYRDRSEGEQETRDIYSTMWIEDGWTVPTPVYNDNWLINGCPVNGPAIAALGNNAVTTWFTAAKDIPQVLVAFSEDGGLNFESPIRVDAGDAIGRVDTVMLADESALVLWMEPDADEVLLQLKRIRKDGITESTKTISRMSGERASGFPQLEVVGDTVYIAWTDATSDMSGIKMLTVSIQ